jgi:hypothetical protein
MDTLWMYQVLFLVTKVCFYIVCMFTPKMEFALYIRDAAGVIYLRSKGESSFVVQDSNLFLKFMGHEILIVRSWICKFFLGGGFEGRLKLSFI